MRMATKPLFKRMVKSRMKNRSINLGMMLILFGTVFLLINAGLLNWTVFSSLEYLWPVILIIIGVSIVFNNNPMVSGALWIGFLILIIAFSTVYKPIINISVKEAQYSTIEKFPETKYGTVKFESGASQLNVSSDDKNLITISSNDKNFKCDSNYKNNKENVSIRVEHNPRSLDSVNELDAKLNKSVIWDLRFDLGASKANLDLSKNTISKLEVHAGAAKLDLTLGKPTQDSDVSLEFGASDVNLSIPKDIGVKIRLRSALSNNNLNTLGWKYAGDTYYSPNFDTSTSKYNIDLQMGAGNFNVEQK